jgi:hypothetical protein
MNFEIKTLPYLIIWCRFGLSQVAKQFRDYVPLFTERVSTLQECPMLGFPDKLTPIQ